VLDNLQNCAYPKNRLPEQLRDPYQAVPNSLLVDALILERCNDASILFAARAGMVFERAVADFLATVCVTGNSLGCHKKYWGAM
jgi:hypothetical protein